jgi:hypothetical protein
VARPEIAARPLLDLPADGEAEAAVCRGGVLLTPWLPCGWAHQIGAMLPITGPQSAILNHKVWGQVALSCEHATSSLVTRPVLELGQPSFDVTVVVEHGRGADNARERCRVTG